MAVELSGDVCAAISDSRREIPLMRTPAPVLSVRNKPEANPSSVWRFASADVSWLGEEALPPRIVLLTSQAGLLRPRRRFARRD